MSENGEVHINIQGNYTKEKEDALDDVERHRRDKVSTNKYVHKRNWKSTQRNMARNTKYN